MEMTGDTSKGSRRIPRLVIGGQFHVWKVQIELYFRSLGFWDHVKSGTEPTIREGGPTAEQIKARCKGDLLLCLDRKLLALVIHCDSSKAILEKLAKNFTGSDLARKRTLRKKFEDWEFRGDYGAFFRNINQLVDELIELEGVYSYKDISLAILNKLPKEHVAIIHQL